MAAAEEALKEALCVAGMHHALAGLLFVCQRQELAPLAQAALCSLWNLASPLKLRSEVAQGSVAHALRDTIDHLGIVPDVLEWSARVAWLLAEEPSTSELLTACSIPEAPTLGLLEILKAPAGNDSSFSSDLSSPTGAGARSFTSDREPRGSSLGQPSRLPDGPAGPNSGTKRPEKEDQCLIPGPCAQVSASVGDVGVPEYPPSPLLFLQLLSKTWPWPKEADNPEWQRQQPGRTNCTWDLRPELLPLTFIVTSLL